LNKIGKVLLSAVTSRHTNGHEKNKMAFEMFFFQNFPNKNGLGILLFFPEQLHHLQEAEYL
jgi:hypothetical protein